MPEEQLLFARLAVFPGGCTLRSAEEIARAGLDTLQLLVDKSLLRHTEGRFSMLETIREYAVERLEDSGQAGDLRRRHAEHFLALAEEAEPSVLGVSPGEWLDRLERDHDNLRAALDWLEASGESQLALRLAGAVWEFWCLRGHPTEGWRRLEDLLRTDERPTMARAKALTGAAHLAEGTGAGAAGTGFGPSRLRAEQALALHRELGDSWGIAYAEYQFAAVFTEEGDFAAARPLFEESVRRLRELGDEHRALQATRALAWCYLELGDAERYKTMHEDLLRRARVARDEQMEGRSLAALARVATDQGRFQDAFALLKDAYRIDREYGDPFEIAFDLVLFARILAFAERAESAARLLSRSEALREELDGTYAGWMMALKEETLAAIRAQLDEAAFAEAWEQGRTLTLDEAVALALDSVGLGAARVGGSRSARVRRRGATGA